MSSMFGSASAQSQSNATADKDLVEIETEQLGFQAVSGDQKLRLLPQPWPAESLPSASASLLSIASRRGLVAAAGPDQLLVASTDQLRQTLISEKADGGIKSYAAQATLPIPRVNQVTFSSDESCLVIAAEQGGGLAIYDTNALVNGAKESAFQIGTNGVAVRQLLPNPNPSSDLAHYFAIVLEGGQLLLADLKARKLMDNVHGNPVFHENVVSACWSRLGRQIIAGRRNGTAVQIDPQGVVKAEIPLPPRLPELMGNPTAPPMLSSIYWLETNDFLLIHSPETSPKNDDSDMMDNPPDNSYLHFARREKGSSQWIFQTMVDPTPAFLNQGRSPTHHFIQRLREWPPSLDDTLVLVSTSASEVGLLTKSKTPLNSNDPVINAFTTTTMPDSRRAALPVSLVDDFSETSAIGVALDLSVKEKIPRPIPTDETLDTSPVPLPALYVLNNEGILRIWYTVYNDSIRAQSPFPDLIAAGGPRSLDKAQNATSTTTTTSPATVSSPFGTSNTSTPFGKQSSFGGTTATFGGASALGSRQSLWGSTGAGTSSPAAAKPTFGATSTLGGSSGAGTAFGQVGGMGMSKASVWGSPSQPVAPNTAGNSSIFGGNVSAQSPFASVTQKADGATKASPFATVANTAGSATSVFGSATALSNSNKPSIFGAATNTSTTTQPSIFGSAAAAASSGNNSSPFASAATQSGEQKSSPFATKTDSTNDVKSSPFMSQPSGSQKSLFDTSSKEAKEASPSAAITLENDTSTTASPFANLTSNNRAPNPFEKDAAGKQGLQAEKSGSTASFSSFGSFGSGNTFGQSSTNGVGSFSFGKPSLSRDATGNSESKFGAAGGENKLSAMPTEGFKLGTTFQGVGAAAKDLPQPKETSPFFGAGFGAALGEVDQSSKSDPKIKTEPGTEATTKLSDIPPVQTQKEQTASSDPLTYKPKRFTGDIPPADVPAEDPLNQKTLRYAGDLPPVDVPEEKPTKDQTEKTSQAAKSSSEGALAGSPPVDLSGAKFSNADLQTEDLPPAPEDDDDDDWAEEGDENSPDEDQSAELDEEDDEDDENDESEVDEDGGEDDDEEDGEDEDEEDDSNPPTISDPKALSNFMSRITPASPDAQSSPTASHTPATQKRQSFTPAGFPKAPITFGLPTRNQESPRSPSPQRAVTSPLFSPKPESMQAFSNSNASKNHTFSTNRGAHQPQRIAVPPAPSIERQPTRAKAAVPPVGDLEDEDDAQVQALLAQRPKPTTEVPYFLAHQNYVGKSTKDGIGGQIERVYRDINSMIDTLGLNAHSLRGFVDGHMELGRSGERSRDDLVNEKGWVLDEISDLAAVQDELRESLTAGQLDGVEQKKRAIFEVQRATAQLQFKSAGVRKQLSRQTDPEQLLQQLNAPLPLEAQVQQTELRNLAAQVQKDLVQVEDSLSELRADLASCHSTSKVPTVEAVIKTVMKMTAMIQQKSGDIDVLEAQIRRLPSGLPPARLPDDYEDDLVAALRGSRLPSGSPGASTPSRPASRRTAFNGDPLGMSGMLGGGRYRTPPHQRRSLVFSPDASMLGRSVGSITGSARKKMQDVSDHEVTAYETRMSTRRKVMDALRNSVEKKGERITTFEA